MKANKRRFAIGFYLLSGFTPWGVQLDEDKPQLPDCAGDWIMCCGHVLRPHELQAWRDSGLVIDGPIDEAG